MNKYKFIKSGLVFAVMLMSIGKFYCQIAGIQKATYAKLKNLK